MKVAGLRRVWLRSVLAYTAAGSLASGLVGLAAGWAGGLLPPDLLDPWALLAAALVGLAVAVRESVGRTWPIPQLHRQTPEWFRVRYRPPLAAALWGFDLGLVFSTWLTFAGPWFVLAVAVASGSPPVGAGLFLAHWLTRAGWLWLSPWLLTDARVGPAVAGQVMRAVPIFRAVQVAAALIGVAALVLVVLA